MDIKLIEQRMRDFITKIGGYQNIVFFYLPLFYTLSLELYNLMKNHFGDIKFEIDYNNITKVTILDKIDILKNFYNEVGIDFDIDKYISNGTIEFKYYDYFYDNEDTECYKKNKFVQGVNYYNGRNKVVDICDNGFITDAITVVHEISHLRNQPDNGRSQVSDLLTETLAYLDEYMFLDYLSKLGYNEDVKLWFNRRNLNLFNLSNEMKSIYRMFLLFDELGSISKEDYKYYFETDEGYDDDLNHLINHIEEDFYNFISGAWYILAAFLAPYMNFKYKNDNSYMNNINKLHDIINGKNMDECFSLIGITNFGENEKQLLIDNLNLFIEQFNNVKTL